MSRGSQSGKGREGPWGRQRVACAKAQSPRREEHGVEGVLSVCGYWSLSFFLQVSGIEESEGARRRHWCPYLNQNCRGGAMGSRNEWGWQWK